MKRNRDDEESEKVRKTNSDESVTDVTLKRSVPREMEVEDAVVYLEQVRLAFASKPSVYLKFVEILDKFQEGSLDATSVAQRVKALLSGHKSLIVGFNSFLPPKDYIDVDDLEDDQEESEKDENKEGKPAAPSEFKEALNCIERIRQRFDENSETYRTFLSILDSHQREKWSVQEVFEKVSHLFSGHQDIIDEFARFLPKSAQYYQQEKKKRLAKEKKQKSKKKIRSGVLEHPPFDNVDASQMRFREHFAKPNKDKYGPSYRLLPKNFPQSICSERSELCQQVLNDELVSVPAGSEENRDIGARDTAAETLFQCEDDRTELDIVTEQTSSVLHFLAPYHEQIQKGQNIEFDFKSFPRIHKVAICRIYGDNGKEILTGLQNRPMAAIPLIYVRLEQKLTDWTNARKELNRFWKKVYRDNTALAENQEISRFKKLDAKRLQIASVLQDAAQRAEFNVNLVTDMTIRSIHKDIFTLLLKNTTLNEGQVKFLKELYQYVLIPFFDVDKKKQKETNEEFEQLQEEEVPKKFHIHKLYTTADLMVFLRYYQYMYERLTRANIRAYRQKKIDEQIVQRKAAFAIVNTHQDEVEDSTTYTGTIIGAHVRKSKSTKEHKVLGDNYYKIFLNYVNDLFSKKITRDHYQNSVKKLLGYQAYEVFTMDYIFKAMEHQLNKLTQDNDCQILIQSFYHESKRKNSFQDDRYLQNILQSSSKQEQLFLHIYNLKSRQMITQAVDPPQSFPEQDKRHSQGLNYIQGFVQSQTGNETKAPNSTNQVFLKRARDKVEKEPLEPAKIHNGMEYKLCIETQKCYFTEGTSDILLRKRKNV